MKKKQPKGFHDHNPPGTKLYKKATRKNGNIPTLGIPHPGGIVSNTFRITAQKRALAKLRESE